MKQQTLFGEAVEAKAVNVASVPQRSLFRYPGGKTWLIPIVRKWLRQVKQAPLLIEPFVGGGIVSLTAAFEKLAKEILMVEKDEEVAAVWKVITNGENEWLADKIMSFDLTENNIIAEFQNPEKLTRDIAFCTILKNRTFHGGIIAKGSGFLKHGEAGKGIKSRWYAQTLKNRILAIGQVSDKLNFVEGDAFEIIEQNLKKKTAFFFIDPPYTVAGKRLYTYYDIDHERLFALASRIQGKFMLTYDDTEQIRNWADKYNLKYRTTPMKTTHHLEKNEIIISDNFSWW
jgi:DNA adenine methylase